MLIDWFTVIAQAINFIILVWLMKRFLYHPILHAIDEREKRIAAELADAEAKKAGAEKESNEFRRKNEDFDKERASLLSRATDEADTERKRLIGEAQKAADTLSAQRAEAFKNDAIQLRQAITQKTQQAVFSITRKALTDLAGTSLEEQLVKVFSRRLQEMDSAAKESLSGALKDGSEPALIRTAFDLPEAQRSILQTVVNETFQSAIPLRFETAPDLTAGIELLTQGQKLAWTISEYLVSMQKNLSDSAPKTKDE
ncbi:MAG: F0F1 ATP synthase subunit B [Elusimicrobia bacterium RIFOXYB2_FULL_49_7]|nr:MAG: F0F1 ATP synthase subunit B [Elusimicrobia bacterium RIFOXYB2_FULL_49_7]